MKKKGPNVFGEARQRFINKEPVVMSDRVRRLAEKVLAQQKSRQNEDPEVWARKVVDSMYSKPKKK